MDVGHVDESNELIASQYGPAISARSEALISAEQFSNAVVHRHYPRVFQVRSELRA